MKNLYWRGKARSTVTARVIRTKLITMHKRETVKGLRICLGTKDVCSRTDMFSVMDHHGQQGCKAEAVH